MILGDGTHDFNVGDRVRVLWCYGKHEQHVGAVGNIIGFDASAAFAIGGRPGRWSDGLERQFRQGAYVRFDDQTIQPIPQCLTDDVELVTQEPAYWRS